MSFDTREGASSAAFRTCTPQTNSSPIPELRLSQIVQTVLDGYADRPALGQRSS
jgi:hypothetical protein